ncbi:MAG TPA: signal recognition particle receptor subunit alpha, partial [Candidatus Obscuribacterales bacterium]
MTNFNWFSRSFDESSQPEQQADPPAPPAEETAKTDDNSSQMSPEDYLAWAKAAYQNIQKQQASTAAPETVAATDPATPEAAAPAAETPVAAAETPTPDAPPADLAGADGNATTDDAAAAVGPAWMQSAAERQARLERLQETAIAEPEPEPESTDSTTATAPPLPDLNFDEAFLWSAEVLAGQGRQAADISIEEITWLNRLRQGLDKTRRGLVNQLKAIVGQGPLNEDAVFEIEALLLQADVGVEATDAIIAALQARLREEALPPEQAIAYLKQILRDMLDQPLNG